MPLTLYGEKVLSAYPCVSFRLIENTGAKWPVHVHGGAIYAAEQDFLSRPIIGHTPRKLPALAAISRIIALIGRANTGKPIHALRKLNYCTRLHRSCQEGFSLFYSFFLFHSSALRSKGPGEERKRLPWPRL